MNHLEMRKIRHDVRSDLSALEMMLDILKQDENLSSFDRPLQLSLEKIERLRQNLEKLLEPHP